MNGRLLRCAEAVCTVTHQSEGRVIAASSLMATCCCILSHRTGDMRGGAFFLKLCVHMTTKPVDPKKKAASLRGNANALKVVRQRQIDREVFDFNASPAAALDQKKWRDASEALRDLEKAWQWDMYDKSTE